jgi:hypothetical protein
MPNRWANAPHHGSNLNPPQPRDKRITCSVITRDLSLPVKKNEETLLLQVKKTE